MFIKKRLLLLILFFISPIVVRAGYAITYKIKNEDPKQRVRVQKFWFEPPRLRVEVRFEQTGNSVLPEIESDLILDTKTKQLWSLNHKTKTAVRQSLDENRQKKVMQDIRSQLQSVQGNLTPEMKKRMQMILQQHQSQTEMHISLRPIQNKKNVGGQSCDEYFVEINKKVFAVACLVTNPQNPTIRNFLSEMTSFAETARRILPSVQRVDWPILEGRFAVELRSVGGTKSSFYHSYSFIESRPLSNQQMSVPEFFKIEELMLPGKVQ